MNLLTIGNSFSEDATRYLHQIAQAGGKRLTAVNLFIGGCSLERHYRNMLSHERAYQIQYNGENTGFFVSLEEALLSRQWDVITLQQASPFSFDAETYVPYIDALMEYVRKCAPKARVLLHETWAYEEGSERLSKMGFDTESDMREAVVRAYRSIAEQVGFDGIIPSGELFGALREAGIKKIHRDTFHVSWGLGRYALGLLWYRTLLGGDVLNNTFRSFDEEITEQDMQTVRECVMKF